MQQTGGGRIRGGGNRERTLLTWDDLGRVVVAQRLHGFRGDGRGGVLQQLRHREPRHERLPRPVDDGEEPVAVPKEPTAPRTSGMLGRMAPSPALQFRDRLGTRPGDVRHDVRLRMLALTGPYGRFLVEARGVRGVPQPYCRPHRLS